MLQHAGAGLSVAMRQVHCVLCPANPHPGADAIAHTQVLLASLALRKYSPRVELFRSLEPVESAPKGSCCWVQLPGGRAVSSAPELRAALATLSGAEADAATVHPLDHVHPGSPAAARSAILYAPLGAPCFPALHAALVEAAAAGTVRYALRPVPPRPGCLSAGCASARYGGADGPLLIGAFGVEMALKNTEYKAIDDSAKQQASEQPGGAAAAAAHEEEAEVRGFAFGTLSSRRPELAAELATFRDALLSAAESDGAQLKVWDMKDLGVQAAARVAGSADPLRLLQDVAHAFPSLAGSLSRMRVNSSLLRELDGNQRQFRGGSTMLTLNGQPLDCERLDGFSLLDSVAAELRFADSLSALRLPHAAARALSQLPALEPGSLRVRTAGAPALWANDVSSDAFAQKWPTSLRSLLQPRFPGRLPSVRRNLFCAIFVAEPAGEDALQLAEAVEYYLASGVALRFGLVPCTRHACRSGEQPQGEENAEGVAAAVDGELSRRVARLFAAVAQAHGAPLAWQWLAAASQARRARADHPQRREPLSWAVAESSLAALLQGRSEGRGGDAQAQRLAQLAAQPGDASAESQQLDAQLLAGFRWAQSRGVASAPLTLLLNGLVYTQAELGGQSLDYAAVLLASQEAQGLAEALYSGQLEASAGEEELAAWLYRDAVPTHNAAILSREAPPQRVHMAPQPLGLGEQALRYVCAPPNADAVAAVTHLLLADLGSAPGRAVAAAAAGSLARGTAGHRARLAFLHSGAGEGSLLARALLAATRLPSRRAKLAPFLAALLDDEEAARASDAGLEGELAVRVTALADAAGLRGDALAQDVRTGARQAGLLLQAQAAYARSGALGAAATAALAVPGGAALLSNGRVTALTPTAAQRFRPDDMDLLEAVELRDSAAQVVPLVEAHLGVGAGDQDDAPAERLSDAVAVACSVLAARRAAVATQAGRGGLGGGGSVLEGASLELSGIKQGDPASAQVLIEGVLDPLSKEAQRVAPLLLLLREALGPALALRLALNPARDLSDLPLKAYYRYAAPSLRQPLVQAPPPAAHFAALPPSRTLTLGIDAPDAWLVQSFQAPYDLDNLRLEDLGSAKGFAATFQLENLLVSGHASEAGAQQPPRGVQLTLEALAPPFVQGGTIVMSNLGYFQLKAAPGLHTLSIAPGRSVELYHLASGGLSDLAARAGGHSLATAAASSEQGEPTSATVAVGDFSGRLLRLRLRKREGMDKEDVLALGGKDSSLWGRARTMFGAQQPLAGVSGEDNSKIHIFSVASGHLYERFLKIMVLSVLRTTHTPCKFWFIKNYLSPGFKAFLPAFAAQYGFEYELITYKWPTWLHKQTEKQRIIWAYKVLFLDVLFPLTLKKVIFVDADQIVRTDMKQLMELDLEGAPLGYTPMCDNNREMEGFRFWKQGFWRDHLRGRPYHISALYVVDLAAFRQQAAGDQFRILYDSLAKDPNSLANLDQDLPNYAQHQVRIFSLPQEWLWCESWCGNATKAAAKTIDLCNNPMTKEPKLQGARRIVAEWTALDDEARAFTDRLEAGELQAEQTHSSRADASEL